MSRFQRCLLLAMAVGLTATAVAGEAESSRILPSGVEPAAEVGNFRVMPIQAKDKAGRVLALPAWRIDAQDYGASAGPPAHGDSPPAFTGRVPAAQQSQLALYYFYGWRLLPRGWRVTQAYLSGDTSAVLELVAPGGPAQGWLSLREIYVCVGCMYEAADGLLPGVHRIDVDEFDAPDVKPRFLPAPVAIHHPDRCTALLAYHPAGSPPVRAALRWSGGIVVSVYVAAPPPLASRIVDRYLHAADPCDSGRVGAGTDSG